MNKFKILKEMPINRTYASDYLPNLGKCGKPIYVNDWGIVVPVCPFCNENAYESTHCVFCGAESEQLTAEEIKAQKEANHEYTVTYKNIKDCLDAVNSGKADVTILNGYELNFNKCSICGIKLTGAGLNVGVGGFVCDVCKDEFTHNLEKNVFASLKIINNVDMSNLATVKLNNGVLLKCILLLKININTLFKVNLNSVNKML